MTLLTQSLWRDEAFSALLIQHNPLDIVKLTAGDSNPPLFYLLLHYWTLVFGNSEVAMRSLTLIFLLATAVTMYFIGRMFFRRSGVWLAALTITQPFLFYYGFELRGYSLLALLATLTIYFYLRNKRWLLFLSAAALLYTHLFGWWVILILGGWSIFRRQNAWPLVAAGLVGLLWVPNYLNFARVGGGFLSTPGIPDLLTTLVALGAPILILTLPYLRGLWRQERFQLFFLLWIVPIVGTFLISQVKPEFLDRYLIVTVPAEILLVGMTIGKRFSAVLLTATVIIQAVLSYQSFGNPQKPPFRELANFVLSQRQPGDAIVNASSLTYFESQYYGLNAPIYSPQGTVPYYVGKVLIPDRDILTKLPGTKRLWLIELEEGGGSLTTPLPLRIEETRNFGRLKLTLYETPT